MIERYKQIDDISKLMLNGRGCSVGFVINCTMYYQYRLAALCGDAVGDRQQPMILSETHQNLTFKLCPVVSPCYRVYIARCHQADIDWMLTRTATILLCTQITGSVVSLAVRSDRSFCVFIAKFSVCLEKLKFIHRSSGAQHCCDY